MQLARAQGPLAKDVATCPLSRCRPTRYFNAGPSNGPGRCVSCRRSGVSSGRNLVRDELCLSACLLKRAPHRLGGDRKSYVTHAQVPQRVDHRVPDRGWRTDRPAFAATFDA
jgi:hypothetical protein